MLVDGENPSLKLRAVHRVCCRPNSQIYLYPFSPQDIERHPSAVPRCPKHSRLTSPKRHPTSRIETGIGAYNAEQLRCAPYQQPESLQDATLATLSPTASIPQFLFWEQEHQTTQNARKQTQPRNRCRSLLPVAQTLLSRPVHISGPANLKRLRQIALPHKKTRTF